MLEQRGQLSGCCRGQPKIGGSRDAPFCERTGPGPIVISWEEGAVEQVLEWEAGMRLSSGTESRVEVA